MKKCFVVFSLLAASTFAYSQTWKVMTYNIRYDNPDAEKNNWDDRKVTMIELIKYYHPHFLGIQEGLPNQVQYLDSCLSKYTYIGIGREGDQKGEFSALFYDSTLLKLEMHSTFWLSDTPEKVSVGWDAALPRICTYGLFEWKESGKMFWVFNTHFDHVGELARENSAKLIVEKIQDLNKENYPVILTGDLNAEPDGKVIRTLTSILKDGWEISVKPSYGPTGTFNGFDTDLVMERRIDYIMTSGLKVLDYRHIDDRLDNNNHISDHLAVFARVALDKE